MHKDIENTNTTYIMPKKHPEIIEDAEFYRNKTYIAIMVKIEKVVEKGETRIFTDQVMSKNMTDYLKNKGFTVTHFSTSSKIEW